MRAGVVCGARGVVVGPRVVCGPVVRAGVVCGARGVVVRCGHHVRLGFKGRLI